MGRCQTPAEKMAKEVEEIKGNLDILRRRVENEEKLLARMTVRQTEADIDLQEIDKYMQYA